MRVLIFCALVVAGALAVIVAMGAPCSATEYYAFGNMVKVEQCKETFWRKQGQLEQDAMDSITDAGRALETLR